MREKNLAEVVITVKLGMLNLARVWLRPAERRRSEKTAEGGGERLETRWSARRAAERETASYWRKKGSTAVEEERGRAWNSEVEM